MVARDRARRELLRSARGVVQGRHGRDATDAGTARQYGVTDPYSSRQSISAGARHLRNLDALYDGDRVLVAAAYNAGVGAVTRYEGVPPYPETQGYVAKVQALYASYQAALAPTRAAASAGSASD